jgi:hypothetical protein
MVASRRLVVAAPDPLHKMKQTIILSWNDEIQTFFTQRPKERREKR